jgi:hypothetical protein
MLQYSAYNDLFRGSINVAKQQKLWRHPCRLNTEASADLYIHTQRPLRRTCNIVIETHHGTLKKILSPYPRQQHKPYSRTSFICVVWGFVEDMFTHI